MSDRSHRKIMLVDDNPMNIDILRRILRDGYQLEAAGSGEECLTKLREFRPQLVLLDIMMPGMDGYEVCRRIKERTGDDFVQVILLSGKGSTAERLQGYQAHADDYLVKPYDHGELRSKVDVQFRLWEAQHRLQHANQQLTSYSKELESLVAKRTKQIVTTQDATLFALAQLTESRHLGTGEHVSRMRQYAQRLATRLSSRGPYADQIDDQFLEDFYRSTPLHDIGNVAIPDAVLLKPGVLTREERDVMERHVLVGAQTLEKAQERAGGDGRFLRMAAEIARYHHEWFDGSGYCEGLRGDAIPLAARITAVADVFDALTSDREYRSAFEPRVAAEIIAKESGTHFDPAIVDAFRDLEAEFFVMAGRSEPTITQQETLTV